MASFNSENTTFPKTDKYGTHKPNFQQGLWNPTITIHLAFRAKTVGCGSHFVGINTPSTALALRSSSRANRKSVSEYLHHFKMENKADRLEDRGFYEIPAVKAIEQLLSGVKPYFAADDEPPKVVKLPKSGWADELFKMLADEIKDSKVLVNFEKRFWCEETRQRHIKKARENFAISAPIMERMWAYRKVSPCVGSPIRTYANNVPAPSPPSDEAREKVRKMALALGSDFHEPYQFAVRASLEDGSVPLIKGTIRLNGLDAESSDTSVILKNVDMIFDTGCQTTVITEDLLPKTFRQYLKDTIHDPYRGNVKGTKDGVKIQVEANIQLSNSEISVYSVAWVSPKEAIPNLRSGILLGQTGVIDSMAFQCIPRKVLEARGEDIGEEFWGDLVLEQYAGLDGLKSF